MIDNTFKQIKLIATDLDGTLVNSNDVISKVSIQVLKEAMKKGYYVSFLTGRHWKGLRRVSRQIQINAPFVCANGAQIIDANGSKPIQEVFIEEAAVREIADFLIQQRIDFVIRGNETALYNDNPQHLVKREIEERMRLQGKDDMEFPVIHSGKDERLNDFHAVKMIIRFAPKQQGVDEVKQFCANDARIHLVTSGHGLLEIGPKQASKGEGLRQVCHILGIRLEECLYFGDQENDISAFQAAGISACVENGSVQAKAHADYICETNDADGVANFIKRYVLEG